MKTIKNEITTLIDSGSKFEGRLYFSGHARISGDFNGEIYTNDTLIITEGARVKASVDAGVVVIGGNFEGILRAKERIEMHPPAMFKGTCITPKLKIEEGVVFQGESKTLS